jgi:hypothetical protein
MTPNNVERKMPSKKLHAKAVADIMKALSSDDKPIEFYNKGKKWSDHIARYVLPVLLGRAKAGETVTYKELAHRIHELYGEQEPKSYRNYGHPPGKIGTTLELLETVWKSRIPPLNAIVINHTTKLPGNGAYTFIGRYLKKKIKPIDKPECAEMAFKSVFSYPKWDKVASYFGVEIDEVNSTEEKESPISLPDPKSFRGGGEGPAHKALKEWVRVHPELFKENFGIFAKGEKEERVQSGDRLDVFFRNLKTQLAVEVKDGGCPDSELYRGIFQCVKYRAVLRATQFATGEIENAQAVLVTQRVLPMEVNRLAERLNVLIIKVQ